MGYNQQINDDRQRFAKQKPIVPEESILESIVKGIGKVVKHVAERPLSYIFPSKMDLNFFKEAMRYAKDNGCFGLGMPIGHQLKLSYLAMKYSTMSVGIGFLIGYFK